MFVGRLVKDLHRTSSDWSSIVSHIYISVSLPGQASAVPTALSDEMRKAYFGSTLVRGHRIIFDLSERHIYKHSWHESLIHAITAASVRAAHLITAIVRMLGKAVKLRHCPATVSAPASTAVIFAAAGSQYGHPRLF